MHILNLDLHWKKELPWTGSKTRTEEQSELSELSTKGLLFFIAVLQALGMRQIYEEFALNVIMYGTNITGFEWH